MATITPNEGLEFIADKTLDDATFADWKMYQVAVGTGSAGLNASDTQLDTEVYRADSDDSVVSIEDSSTAGKITVQITLSGGTEVPSGTSITEFGIFAADPNDAPTDETTDAKDRLLHRELRSAVILEAGDRKTFQIEYFVEDT